MSIRYSYWVICLAAGLCAPSAFAGSNQTVPGSGTIVPGKDPIEGISYAYSDIDMRLRLAAKPDGKSCSGDACKENAAFDLQVQELGRRLAQLAYEIYPELKKRTPGFEFAVTDKKGIGCASSANGKVVVFRSVQNLDLGEEAMAFLIAREMGHVIARHHNDNAMTKILFSVLSGVLFPAVSLLSASSAAAQATTATSVMTSAASTVTSYVGSEVALSRIKPSQLTEADDISINLLMELGYTKAEMAQSLEFIVEKEQADGWEKDLYQSIHYTRKLAGPPMQIVENLGPMVTDSSVVSGTGVEAGLLGNMDQPRIDIAHISAP